MPGARSLFLAKSPNPVLDSPNARSSMISRTTFRIAGTIGGDILSQ